MTEPEVAPKAILKLFWVEQCSPNSCVEVPISSECACMSKIGPFLKG